MLLFRARFRCDAGRRPRSERSGKYQLKRAKVGPIHVAVLIEVQDRTGIRRHPVAGFGILRVMVGPDAVDQLRRQLSVLGQPHPDLGVVHADQPPFVIDQREPRFCGREGGASQFFSNRV